MTSWQRKGFSINDRTKIKIGKYLHRFVEDNMYYTEFKSWLDEQNVSTKIQKDYVSRLKAIQRDLSPSYAILEE